MARPIQRDFLYPERQSSFNLYRQELKHREGLQYYQIDIDGARLGTDGRVEALVEYRTRNYYGADAEPAMKTLRVLSEKLGLRFESRPNKDSRIGDVEWQQRIYIASTDSHEILAVFSVVQNGWPDETIWRYRLWPGPSSTVDQWSEIEARCDAVGIETRTILLLYPGGVPEQPDEEWLVNLTRPRLDLRSESVRDEVRDEDESKLVDLDAPPELRRPSGIVRRLVLTRGEAKQLMGFDFGHDGAPRLETTVWQPDRFGSGFKKLTYICQYGYRFDLETREHIVFLDQTHIDYGVTSCRSKWTGQFDRNGGGYQNQFPYRAASKFTNYPAAMPLLEEVSR